MTTKTVVIAVVSTIAVLILVIIMYGISASNSEKRLRNAISAKQQDNKSEFDNMWKKISQVAQVGEAERLSLMDLFTKHAAARGGGNENAIVSWVQESVPNVDSSLYKNIQNIIVGSRDSWTMRQKEILDLKREHDNLLDTFPSSLFVGSRDRIEVTIITSGRTEKVFETGKDDDVELFKKK